MVGIESKLIMCQILRLTDSFVPIFFADGNCETTKCADQSTVTVPGPGAPATSDAGGGEGEADYGARVECHNRGKLSNLIELELSATYSSSGGLYLLLG